MKHKYPYKYFIIDYSIWLHKYILINVDLEGEEYSEKQQIFILRDEDGEEYRKELQEIYSIEDLEYLREKVKNFNKAQIKETEEIEELTILDNINYYDKYSIAMNREKLNELVRAENKINKEREEK